MDNKEAVIGALLSSGSFDRITDENEITSLCKTVLKNSPEVNYLVSYPNQRVITCMNLQIRNSFCKVLENSGSGGVNVREATTNIASNYLLIEIHICTCISKLIRKITNNCYLPISTANL